MNDYFSDWRVSSGYNVLFVNLTSMQVCKFGQPGKYVRLEGVDVHADSNRPSGANPKIKMVTNAIICKPCGQYSGHHQMLGENIKKLVGGRIEGGGSCTTAGRKS